MFLGCEDGSVDKGFKDGYEYEIKIEENKIIFHLRSFESVEAKRRWKLETDRMGGEVWRTNRKWRRRKRGREEGLKK